jgi:excisionase family DNA binding protein
MKEVAELLRCGLSTAYDLKDNGSLRHFRLGRRKGIRVLRSDLEELMRPGPQEPPPAPTPAGPEAGEAAPGVGDVTRRCPRGRKAKAYEDVVRIRPAEPTD